MDSFQLYRDMKTRTNGEFYIGVVGPVRTGKSTFIKRFMDLLVLPNMTDGPSMERTKDELPQSASGTTIMTTEPKFVPKDAAEIRLTQDVEVKIRLIDCVGFMIPGVIGNMENDNERQVKTPWFEHEIPFSKAAAIGTEKVIRDHASIGIVVTTDGSITELPRENYVAAEEKTIKELQGIGKPFIILLNCKKPYTKEAKELQKSLEEKYQTAVVAINCEQMKEEDIHEIIRQVLYEFPVSEAEFYIPKWVEMLPTGHRIKQEVLHQVKNIMSELVDVRAATKGVHLIENHYIDSVSIDKIEMATGVVKIIFQFEDRYYYEVLSELTQTEIAGQYELIAVLKELSTMKKEYIQIKDAFADVKMKGYGVVSPRKEEIQMNEPEIIKQGNKYGVKIHTEAPSIHIAWYKQMLQVRERSGCFKQKFYDDISAGSPYFGLSLTKIRVNDTLIIDRNTTEYCD